MKLIKILILTIIIASCNTINKPIQKATNHDLKSELVKLHTKTALIVQSQAIDEYPIWSKNGDYIGCNIMGKWYKIRLTDIQLDSAKWKNQTIGILVTKDAGSEMTKDEIIEFKQNSKFQSRKVITSNRTKIELAQNGFTISMSISKKGENPKILWTSSGENCHSLVLSPNEKYVAFLCEMTGLFIMQIE